jgi:hypothetical protein
MMDMPMMVCRAPGTKKAHRQAWKAGTPVFMIPCQMRGMRKCVTPPPMFPQPAAMALAEPTMRALNMLVHQYWQHTKAARENPMNRRSTMKEAALLAWDMQKMTGADSSSRQLKPYLVGKGGRVEEWGVEGGRVGYSTTAARGRWTVHCWELVLGLLLMMMMMHTQLLPTEPFPTH